MCPHYVTILLSFWRHMKWKNLEKVLILKHENFVMRKLNVQNFNRWILSQVKQGVWRRRWHATPVLLPGKCHGWRSLVGCSPWGREESDTTEYLHFHFSLSRIGEGNGNPLQCSCLENSRDKGASWASVYEVAQSRTQLKRLSSSSSKLAVFCVCEGKTLLV